MTDQSLQEAWSQSRTMENADFVPQQRGSVHPHIKVTSGRHLPTHVTPSPEYPVKHLQSKDPLVLVQLASAWQLSISVWHSSISVEMFGVLLSGWIWLYSETCSFPGSSVITFISVFVGVERIVKRRHALCHFCSWISTGSVLALVLESIISGWQSEEKNKALSLQVYRISSPYFSKHVFIKILFQNQ